MNTYDSTKDTRLHKTNVFNTMLVLLLPDLYERADSHDDSKLRDPEKAMYDEFIPKLRTAKYGTKEYEKIRDDMEKGGLQHHYKMNSHHPEHFGDDGINGMDIADLNEMICDWFAASLRSDTSFMDGLDRNFKKYDIPPMLQHIIINTYNNIFKKFEEFMKTTDMDRLNELYKEYKLTAFEECKNGLYSEETRDYILNNLWDIAYPRLHPESVNL